METNLKEFVTLLKQYQSFSIDDARTGFREHSNGGVIMLNLTGFGSAYKCILCTSATNCDDCAWKVFTGDVCTGGVNKESYHDISNAGSPIELYTAVQNRAAHIIETLISYAKPIDEKISLPAVILSLNENSVNVKFLEKDSNIPENTFAYIQVNEDITFEEAEFLFFVDEERYGQIKIETKTITKTSGINVKCTDMNGELKIILSLGESDIKKSVYMDRTQNRLYTTSLKLLEDNLPIFNTVQREKFERNLSLLEEDIKKLRSVYENI